jgi:branched-chain amino acid transport system substrate-binding protein
MKQKRLSGTLLAGAVATALLAAGCASSGSGANGSGGSGPIKIGMSLPLSGPVADVSKGGYEGYKQWVSDVNANGGLLGRKLKLEVLDDGFDQNAVVSNYNKLISQTKVDLVLGTFSSKLNAPASAVAERQGMVYIEPSGGDESLFTRGFKRLFFAQPATTAALPDRFVEWVTSLPTDQRPKTAAYATQDDPGARPAIDGFRKRFEALGIKTVYNEVYSPDNGSFDTIASSIAGKKPDLVVQGAVTDDGTQLIRSFQKLRFSPQMLFQTNAPAQETYAASIGGTANAEGVFTAVGWSAKAKYAGNAEFVSAYTKQFGAPPGEDAANSYTAGQALAAAVKAVGSLDQAALATWLHAHTVDTIVGPLKWDAAGVPQGSLLLAQWQKGVLQTVAPATAATTTTVVNPKPSWKQ